MGVTGATSQQDEVLSAAGVLYSSRTVKDKPPQKCRVPIRAYGPHDLVSAAESRPELCSLQPMAEGFGRQCRATFRMYHWNNTREECVKYLYGGCGGTENLFRTPQECYDTCNGGKPTKGGVEPWRELWWKKVKKVKKNKA